MQARLSPADRKLLWIAGVLGVFFIVATVFISPAIQQNESPVPSSYSGTRSGALAAYLLLDDRGYHVERWLRSPSELTKPDNTVLVLAEPTREVTAADRRALLAFVSAGGRVLFCGGSLGSFLPISQTGPSGSPLEESFEAAVPSHFTRGAKSIKMRASSAWAGKSAEGVPAVKSSTLILYGDAREPVVNVTSIGDGEVLWWSGATPLTNGGITEAQNLRMFLNAFSNPDGSPRSVLWDEYFHGDEGDLWSYVAKTPVPWAMWQLGLAAVVVIFAFSRRRGPIVAPAIRSRLSPLEFVDTMGQLYQHAGAAAVAVEIPYLRLRRQLARRMGRESSLSDAALAKVSAQRLGVPEAELCGTLEAAQQMSGLPKVNVKESLKVAQELARYSRQMTSLRPMSNSSQEKPVSWNN